MLHILNKPPHSEAATQMHSTLAKGDSILLIEDAVQALLHADWQGWNAATDVNVCVLKEDAASRGLSAAALNGHATLVDMEGFVELTEQHTKILSWY
ncbi:sulfurtransferase complex subunit TusB [Halomonas sp. LY9]